jgi:hypothetical protein
MSTFGKKHLLKWDYFNSDPLRFNRTKKELQLDILEKWYPIGESFYYKLIWEPGMTHRSELVKIEGYVNLNYRFLVRLGEKRNPVNPLLLEPTIEFLRNKKLEKILENDK